MRTVAPNRGAPEAATPDNIGITVGTDVLVVVAGVVAVGVVTAVLVVGVVLLVAVVEDDELELAPDAPDDAVDDDELLEPPPHAISNMDRAVTANQDGVGVLLIETVSMRYPDVDPQKSGEKLPEFVS